MESTKYQPRPVAITKGKVAEVREARRVLDRDTTFKGNALYWAAHDRPVMVEDFERACAEPVNPRAQAEAISRDAIERAKPLTPVRDEAERGEAPETIRRPFIAFLRECAHGGGQYLVFDGSLYAVVIFADDANAVAYKDGMEERSGVAWSFASLKVQA